MEHRSTGDTWIRNRASLGGRIEGGLLTWTPEREPAERPVYLEQCCVIERLQNGNAQFQDGGEGGTPGPNCSRS